MSCFTVPDMKICIKLWLTRNQIFFVVLFSFGVDSDGNNIIINIIFKQETVFWSALSLGNLQFNFLKSCSVPVPLGYSWDIQITLPDCKDLIFSGGKKTPTLKLSVWRKCNKLLKSSRVSPFGRITVLNCLWGFVPVLLNECFLQISKHLVLTVDLSSDSSEVW